jgi:aspartyl-tRNA(Asn)/glutamyl-tRNA(Gln) amidotransferase subunit A
MTDLTTLTIGEVHALLKKGEISSVELTNAYLNRIAALDGQIKAYLTVTDTQALAQAREADARRARGEDTPLLGIPLAYKDVLCTRGVQTTCGSKNTGGLPPALYGYCHPQA